MLAPSVPDNARATPSRPPESGRATALPPGALRVLGVATLATLAALSGCAVNPNTGRNQFMAFPAAQAAHANIGYALSTTAQGMGPAYCHRVSRVATESVETGAPSPPAVPARTCPDAASVTMLSQQVARIGNELAAEAGEFAPDLYPRIGNFRISVENDIGGGTISSAGGRIAIDSALADTEPTDDVVAFLIAREMGHVIARHGEEDSGARLAFSVLTTVVPVGGLIVRFAASMLGSQAMKASWAEGQRREADELALVLLQRTDRSPRVIALNLHAGLSRDRLPAGEWAVQFAQSVERVQAIAFIRPRLTGPQLAAVTPRGVAGSVAPEDGRLSLPYTP